jgi:hypothetical protein
LAFHGRVAGEWTLSGTIELLICTKVRTSLDLRGTHLSATIKIAIEVGRDTGGKFTAL